MKKRQEQIFLAVVQEHIQRAEPIGSRLLMERAGLNISSATIRNELVELETAGYIYQPHTSAGRVPTPKGYEFFINNLLKRKKLSKSEQSQLDDFAKNPTEEIFKEFAKFLRDSSNETVIIAFDRNSYYYTGIANLLSKPEFAEQAVLHAISSTMDHLEDTMQDLFDTADEMKILIGESSPFGAATSVIVQPLEIQNQKVVVAVLGPTRMDYAHILSVIDYLLEN